MADLAGLMGAYGSDEESEQMEGTACLVSNGALVEHVPYAWSGKACLASLQGLLVPHFAGEAGGQVTVLGRGEEDEEMVGADLSHLTTTAARAEPDTAGTQPAAGPGQQEQHTADPGADVERLPTGAALGPNLASADAAAQPDATAGPPPSILPPEILQPPEGECNPAVQDKIAFWLNIQRTQGRTLNQQLRHSRAYRNPEFFRKMVEQFEVDEYGSCFAKEVGDG